MPSSFLLVSLPLAVAAAVSAIVFDAAMVTPPKLTMSPMSGIWEAYSAGEPMVVLPSAIAVRKPLLVIP